MNSKDQVNVLRDGMSGKEGKKISFIIENLGGIVQVEGILSIIVFELLLVLEFLRIF